MAGGSRRAIYAALGANLGIAIVKFASFLFTGSASMFAESVHSVADTGNQALLLWGGSAAARAPTPSHPFGFGRERYFWSFIVALVLFSLGGLFAVDHGVEKLVHGTTLHDPEWAVGILLVATVLEGFSFTTAIREARALKGDRSWWRFVRGTKNPELPVVLLEDLGALSGLAIALVGVALSLATGDARYDAAASILIGVLLVVIAIFLANEMKSLLIGEAARAADVGAIRAALATSEGVRGIIHLRTQHLGPDELLVAAKLEFDRALGFEDVSRAIDLAEARVRDALPAFDVMIYLEPDVYHAERAAGEPGGDAA